MYALFVDSRFGNEMKSPIKKRTRKKKRSKSEIEEIWRSLGEKKRRRKILENSNYKFNYIYYIIY